MQQAERNLAEAEAAYEKKEDFLRSSLAKVTVMEKKEATAFIQAAGGDETEAKDLAVREVCRLKAKLKQRDKEIGQLRAVSGRS